MTVTRTTLLPSQAKPLTRARRSPCGMTAARPLAVARMQSGAAPRITQTTEYPVLRLAKNRRPSPDRAAPDSAFRIPHSLHPGYVRQLSIFPSRVHLPEAPCLPCSSCVPFFPCSVAPGGVVLLRACVLRLPTHV